MTLRRFDRNGLVLVLGLLLLSGGGVFLARMATHAPVHPAVAVQKPPGAVRIVQDTMVEFRVGSGKGLVKITEEPASQAGMVGLTLEQLHSLYPSWQVLQFTGKRVVLNEKSPSGQGPLYIGIQHGYVAIFDGVPGKKGAVVDQMTDIPFRHLLPTDQARLRKGIVVKNLADAWRALEGLSV